MDRDEAWQLGRLTEPNSRTQRSEYFCSLLMNVPR